ncbi:MAG TPA: isochorismate synthase [Lentimicrobium sp.]|nr:isochorismate synthase [Lentimicrobium sp.]
MLESKKRSITGLRESFLETGRAFVTYRFPGTTEQMIMSGHVNLLPENNFSHLISGRLGFLMAGFNSSTPPLWLEADYFSRYPASEKLQPAPISETLPLLPLIDVYEVSETDYIQQVEKVTTELKSGKAGKVVLSRMMTTPFENPYSAPALFDWLCHTHQEAFVYLAFLPPHGLWIGATPEKLLTYKEQTVSTMALAGTRKVQSSNEWTRKEYSEHAFVSSYIQEKLEKTHCINIEHSAPYTVRAGKAEHLRTDFTAKCSRHQAAELIKELHPTPAVCGMPVNEALRIIGQTESHERSYYTGFLGPVGNETINLFVNLRCMQLIKEKAIIYAGGGLTADSNPQAEWDETVLKSGTMMAAIEKMRNLAN